MAKVREDRSGLRRGNPGNKGGGRKSKEVKKRASSLLDATYFRTLRVKLRKGTCHPSIESLLWYYKYGKPTEEIEVKRDVPVTIVHRYTREDGTIEDC